MIFFETFHLAEIYPMFAKMIPVHQIGQSTLELEP